MAEIRFEPVCSNCGKRIFGEISCDIMATVYADIASGNTKKMLAKKFSLSPCQCPHCGERFSSVIMPTQLPYDNTKEKELSIFDT